MTAASDPSPHPTERTPVTTTARYLASDDPFAAPTGPSTTVTTTRHTVDLAQDVYTTAADLAASHGLALTDVSRGLYRLYLADEQLQEEVSRAALAAKADLRRGR